jgi:hypothetical protein
MEKIAYSGTAKPPIDISETDYALIASAMSRKRQLPRWRKFCSTRSIGGLERSLAQQ